MKMNDILNTLKRLSLSQGYYDSIYHGIRSMEVTDPESYDFLVEELEAQNFADAIALVLYFEQ